MAESKWEGIAIAKVVGLKPEQVWPLLEDFCAVNKLLPTIETCYRVEGVHGHPGLIRYCASTVPSPSGDTVMWCHEKLLAMDPIKWCMTYEVLDNSMGLKNYFATIKVSPVHGGEDGSAGSKIEWSYTADPVDGHTRDDLSSYIKNDVTAMAESVGKALNPTE